MNHGKFRDWLRWQKGPKLSEEQLAEVEEEYGYIPEHLLPPGLNKENRYTLRLWDIVNQQVKIGPTGIVYAMDVAAVLSILDSVRVENIQDELEKLKIIFEVVYLDKDK